MLQRLVISFDEFHEVVVIHAELGLLHLRVLVDLWGAKPFSVFIKNAQSIGRDLLGRILFGCEWVFLLGLGLDLKGLLLLLLESFVFFGLSDHVKRVLIVVR